MLDLDQIRQWRSDLRHMTKIYKALPWPGPEGPTPEIRRQWVEARRLFASFQENLQGYFAQFPEWAQRPGGKALHSIGVPTLFGSGTRFTWEIDPRAKDSRNAKARYYQRNFRELFKMLDDSLQSPVPLDVKFTAPTEQLRVGPATVVIHNEGRGEGALGKPISPGRGSLNEEALQEVLGILSGVFQKIKRAGFGKALAGLTIHIRFKGRSNAAQSYNYMNDSIEIHGVWMEGADTGNLTHEIGHRFWYRTLTNNARAYWTEMVKSREIKTTDYGATNAIEGFAEAFRLYVDKGPRALNDKARSFFERASRGRVASVVAAYFHGFVDRSNTLTTFRGEPECHKLLTPRQ